MPRCNNQLMNMCTTPSTVSSHTSQMSGSEVIHSMHLHPCPQYRYTYLKPFGASLYALQQQMQLLPVGSIRLLILRIHETISKKVLGYSALQIGNLDNRRAHGSQHHPCQHGRTILMPTTLSLRCQQTKKSMKFLAYE